MSADRPRSFAPPRCVFVTGPRSPGKSRWLDARLAWLRTHSPAARCAVLLADEGLTRTERFAHLSPPPDVRCLFMPCLCCPQVAELPRAVRALAETTGAEWLFIEVPALAAATLIAEFDRAVGWPRETVVWLSRDWARARRAQTLSVFQARLLSLADHVVEAAGSDAALDPAGVPTLSFS